MNTVKKDFSLEYFLRSPYKNVHAFKHVLSEVTSCYTARELSIRYVFIERKRGDEEIFQAEILSGIYLHRNLKTDSRIKSCSDIPSIFH